MKRVTASQARQNWFRLLDEVAAGEVVVIERNGRKIVMKTQTTSVKEQAPDYSAVLGGSVDKADSWGWDWTPSGGLKPKKGGK